MHTIQLAEISSWAAFHSCQLICGSSPLSAATCNEYWVQSKCRQNRWMTALKMFERDLQSDDLRHNPWPAIEIVTQEVFLSEMLTRIWSAVLITHDVYHETDELSGIGHSIHIGHIEAKNRAMRLLLDDQNMESEVFDRMNMLRRKVERWTDLLLSQLPDIDVATRFAFQPNRVSDFFEEDRGLGTREIQTRRLLYWASMLEDLNRVIKNYAANPDMNRKIANGLMACFPADRFDSLGMPKSIQMLWLEKTSNDTFVLMDNLASLENEVNQHSMDEILERFPPELS